MEEIWLAPRDIAFLASLARRRASFERQTGAPFKGTARRAALRAAREESRSSSQKTRDHVLLRLPTRDVQDLLDAGFCRDGRGALRRRHGRLLCALRQSTFDLVPDVHRWSDAMQVAETVVLQRFHDSMQHTDTGAVCPQQKNAGSGSSVAGTFVEIKRALKEYEHTMQEAYKDFWNQLSSSDNDVTKSRIQLYGLRERFTRLDNDSNYDGASWKSFLDDIRLEWTSIKDLIADQLYVDEWHSFMKASMIAWFKKMAQHLKADHSGRGYAVREWEADLLHAYQMIVGIHHVTHTFNLKFLSHELFKQLLDATKEGFPAVYHASLWNILRNAEKSLEQQVLGVVQALGKNGNDPVCHSIQMKKDINDIYMMLRQGAFGDDNDTLQALCMSTSKNRPWVHEAFEEVVRDLLHTHPSEHPFGPKTAIYCIKLLQKNGMQREANDLRWAALSRTNPRRFLETFLSQARGHLGKFRQIEHAGSLRCLDGETAADLCHQLVVIKTAPSTVKGLELILQAESEIAVIFEKFSTHIRRLDRGQEIV